MGEGPYSRKSVSYISFRERLHGLYMVLLKPHLLHGFCQENCAKIQRLTQCYFISCQCLSVVYLPSCYLLRPSTELQLYLAVLMEQAMAFLYQHHVTSCLVVWIKKKKKNSFILQRMLSLLVLSGDWRTNCWQVFLNTEVKCYSPKSRLV